MTLRRAAAVPVLFASALASCMSMPGPNATPSEIEGLWRTQSEARVGASDLREISALWSEGPRGSIGGVDLVIYLHGTPGSAEGWADYLLDPVAGVRAVAIDRPGFGESDPRPLADLVGQAQAIEPLLEDARRVVVVGHSYGGPVAVQAALSFPEKVAGVVIVAGSVAPQLEQLKWFNYVAKGVSWLLPRDLRRANQEVWPLRKDLERMAAELDQVTQPVAIVHGTKDTLVPYGNATFMEQRFSSAAPLTLDRLEDGSHFVIWDEKWVPRVRAAIAEVIAAAGDR